jgi:hypothetical protein
MSNKQLKVWLIMATVSLGMLGCSSDTVVAEKVTDDNGVISACGVGPGLTPCPYYSDDSTKLETNKQLDKEADSINKDTPAQREQAIEEIEAGGNPE